MAELLDRARQLVAAGPYSIRAAETAAVHAALYPSRDAVCETCPAELGKAYYAIKRWLDQQDSSSTSTNLTVSKSTSTARFHSDTTILTPHGLGIAYSNDNLTDSAARYILKNDPDAAQFFKVLPDNIEDGKTDEHPTTEPAPATESAAASAQALTAGIDYNALARAMVDELERREAGRQQQPADQDDEDEDERNDEQPNLSASKGGAADSTDNSDSKSDNSDTDDDSDGEKPVRLSRMNKEQLLAAYRAEVQAEGGLLLVDAHNDDLRAAIAKAREEKAQA